MCSAIQPHLEKKIPRAVWVSWADPCGRASEGGSNLRWMIILCFHFVSEPLPSSNPHLFQRDNFCDILQGCFISYDLIVIWNTRWMCSSDIYSLQGCTEPTVAQSLLHTCDLSGGVTFRLIELDAFTPTQPVPVFRALLQCVNGSASVFHTSHNAAS